MFELTSENYYTPEADREYMSCSQYESFLECEAQAMAKIYGLYTPEPTEALLVGNYVHSALESDEAHEKFIDHNFDLITKNVKFDKQTGEIVSYQFKAPYLVADEIIKTFITDDLLKQYILKEGECERIMTGKIFGVPWKVRFDKYFEKDRMIIDYKTSADLNKTQYNRETEDTECFIEAYGYMMRAAIYSEIEKQNVNSEEDPAFVILAVTKQEYCDKGAYLLNHRQRYDYELEKVEENLAKIQQIREFKVKPKRCGRCPWCRMTKRLKKVVPYYTLKPAFREDLEDEYDDILATYMEKAQIQR